MDNEAPRTRDLATCPLDDIDPADPSLFQSPYDYYTRLRREAPVWRDPRTNVVYLSSHELVREALGNTEVFSSDFITKLMQGTAKPDPEIQEILARSLPKRKTLLYADAPEHTRQKRLAMRAFSPRRVNEMGARIERFTHRLIDNFIEDGGCEFKSAFGDNLPSLVIASMLGLPDGELGVFQSWVKAWVTLLGNQMSDRAARLDAAHKMTAQQEFILDLIADRRRHPGEDLVSDMLAASFEEGDSARPLEDDEIYAMLKQIFTAGQETTAHSLAAGVHYLLSNPAQYDAVRTDPSLVPGFVEETLRLLVPVGAMWRKVTRDYELGATTLRAGDWVLLRYACASRDEARFAEPDSFDVRRENASQHLAFGGGAHLCLGSQLARKEMTIAFPIILDRLRNLRLAEQSRALTYIVTPTVRGVGEVHVTFDKGARRGPG